EPSSLKQESRDFSHERFNDGYFKGLANKLLPYGVDTKQLIAVIWEGTKAMIKKDGTMLNNERFRSRTTDRIILATNPVFPQVATHSRIYWAGLEPNDFELITTYDNSSYCKPNIEYFKEILNSRELSVEQCVMVGNDTHDDMAARSLGMDVFLVTDCLINTKGNDINQYKNGSFRDLYDYINDLPNIN
ncbi:MAG: hypothetical protein EWM47_13560, partial [Anaerolineaceae bacterium]